jgi:interferon gamma-inducible protein 30
MASRPLLPQFLIPFLALLCLAPSCAGRRVSVAVYYEALCPFCSGYVVNDLARIFQNGISSIVDLRLVPFGNGRVSPDGSMTCQVCMLAIV